MRVDTKQLLQEAEGLTGMRLRYIVAPLAIAASLVLGAAVSAQDGPPPPSAGTMLAGGLVSTQGAAVGPDGWLYVTEGGTGGDLDITPDDAPAGETLTFGLTASISRIDPATGDKEVAAEGLPSFGFGDEGGGGLADVAFIGSRMYFLLTGSPGETGAVDYPNGIYRVNDNGTSSLYANIGKFNEDNPVDFEDAGPTGNPFALEARGTTFYVTDGNYNRLLRVNSANNIDVVASFGNVVPTGLDVKGTGPVLFTEFSAFPHAPGDSKVVTVNVPGGAYTELASDYAQMIDVERAPSGKTYVLQFGDQQLDENGPPPPGRILRLEGTTFTPVVEGLTVPTSLDFVGDTALVTTLAGEVWKIEKFSTVALAQASPTAAPSTPVVASPTRATGILPPDTGSGGYGNTDGTTPWAFIALAAAAAMLALGGITVTRRR